MATSEDNVTGEDGIVLEFGDKIDELTFNQILEMDDPGEHDFSSSIVYGFFDQAEETFKTMQNALDAGDLEQLSQLGHFLKGSAATLGLIKVRDGCEHIQRYGKRENLDGSDEPDTQLNLKRIENALVQVQEDYKEVESVLRDYYDKVENDERA